MLYYTYVDFPAGGVKWHVWDCAAAQAESSFDGICAAQAQDVGVLNMLIENLRRNEVEDNEFYGGIQFLAE